MDIRSVIMIARREAGSGAVSSDVAGRLDLLDNSLADLPSALTER